MTDWRRFNLVRTTFKLVRTTFKHVNTTLCNCARRTKTGVDDFKNGTHDLKMMRTTLKFDFKIRALVFLTKFRQKSLKTCA